MLYRISHLCENVIGFNPIQDSFSENLPLPVHSYLFYCEEHTPSFPLEK